MPERLVKLALLANGLADQIAKRELDCQPESEPDHGLTSLKLHFARYSARKSAGKPETHPHCLQRNCWPFHEVRGMVGHFSPPQ
jgi:hypothetical protein